MTAMRKPDPHLIDRLPPVRGRLKMDEPLAPLTWLRVGGPAEVLFRPADEADLAEFLAAKPADVPVTIVGVGSNLLVRDGGVPGVVIRLGRAFARVEIDGDTVTAGAGALDRTVATAAQGAALTGLEFLSGVPGTVGGGLRMNAGAYGREFKDVLIRATAIDATGNRHDMTPDEMGLSYRHSEVSEDWIFTSTVLRGEPGDPDAIANAMREIEVSREESQPLRSRTGGSTFANPEGGKAWEVIDAAGCRGLVVGDAQVSEKHCNFLINRGNATASDIETLGESVRRRVREASGIELRWEVRRIGVPASARGAA